MAYLNTHEKHFSEEKEMINFLEEQDKNDIRSINYIDEGEIINISDKSPSLDATTIATMFGMNLDSDTERAIEECVGGLSCIWKGPVDGVMRSVPISDIALDSLCGRAGLYGPAIKMKPTILNEGMKLKSRTEENKQKVLIRSGSLLAAHSNKYQWLLQGELMRANQSIFGAEIGSYEFKEGAYSDEVTYVKYLFPSKEKEILDRYNTKAAAKGEKMAKKLTPAIIFTTSDTTRSGANLYSAIVTDKGETIRLGSQLSLAHKDGHTITDYVNNCSEMLNILKDSTKRLEALLDIEIRYPEICFENLVKAYSLSGSTANQVYEDFTIRRSATVTAHTLYWELWNIATIESSKGASASKLLDIEEKLARVLFADFKKYDTPMTA